MHIMALLVNLAGTMAGMWYHWMRLQLLSAVAKMLGIALQHNPSSQKQDVAAQETVNCIGSRPFPANNDSVATADAVSDSSDCDSEAALPTAAEVAVQCFEVRSDSLALNVFQLRFSFPTNATAALVK